MFDQTKLDSLKDEELYKELTKQYYYSFNMSDDNDLSKLNDYVKENEININPLQMQKNITSLNNRLNALDEKISNNRKFNSSMKYFMNEIDLQGKSKNSFKHTIAIIFANIIEGSIAISCEDMTNTSYIEYSIELVFNNKELHDLFCLYTNIILSQTSNLSFLGIEKNYLLVKKYAHLFGEYIYLKYSESSTNVIDEAYRSLEQQLCCDNPDEVGNQLIEEHEKRLQDPVKNINKELERINKEEQLKSNPLEINHYHHEAIKKFNQNSKENNKFNYFDVIQRHGDSVVNEDFNKNIPKDLQIDIQKFFKVYKSIFCYDDYFEKNDFERNHWKRVFAVSSIKNTSKFKDYLCQMLCGQAKSYLGEIDPNNDEDIERYSVTSYEFAMTFLELLAYFLYTDLNHNEEESQRIYTQFEIVFKGDEECKQNFADLFKSYDPNLFYLYFNENTHKKNLIVMSVLLTMNKSKISKKVKAFLKDIEKEYPVESSKELYKHFYEEENDDLYCKQYAIDFLKNYFIDPKYIAPQSVFLAFAYEQLDSCFFTNHSITNVQAVLDGERIYDDSSVDDEIREVSSQIDELINYLDRLNNEERKEYISKSLDLFKNALIDAYRIPDELFHLNAVSKLLDQYRTNIISITCGYINDRKVSNEELIRFAVLVYILDSYTSDSNIDVNIYSILDETSNTENTKTIKSQASKITEFEEKIEKLKKEKQIHLDKQKEKIRKENKSTLDSLKSQLSEDNKRIENLENELKQSELDKEELNKLRELMFSLSNEEDHTFKDSNVDYSKELESISKSKKIIFIGGHVGLIKELKAKYPDLIFMGNKDSKVNQSALKNSDLVIILYEYLSHSDYYKTIDILRSNNIRWEYMKGRNLSLVEKELYNLLKNM